MKLLVYRMKGKKGNRINGKSRRSTLDGRARFNYDNKDDPNYRKNYGTKYTERQLMLLSEEIPWETTPINQLTLLMRKAESLGDTENYEKAKRLHHLKKNMDVFEPDLTAEEAIAILRSLDRKTDDG